MLDKKHDHIFASFAALILGVGCSLLPSAVKETSVAIAEDPTGRMARALQALPTNLGCNWTRVALYAQTTPTSPLTRFPLSDQNNTGSWILNSGLSDEFDDNSLDTSKWRLGISGWLGRQPGLFTSQNVSEGNGTLNLKMVHEQLATMYQAAGYVNYTTAAVESLNTVRYGYFEIRAKAMPSAGASAFWLAAQTPDDWNEIDIAEMGGKAPADPNQVFMTVHVFRVQGKPRVWSRPGATNMPRSVASEFHVYGLDWNESSINMYIDGQQVRHICNTDWTMPLNVILDAETVPNWWGLPLFSDLPSTYQVDYLRVWQHAAH